MDSPKKFINWIEICLKSANYSFLINGAPNGGFISPNRGLRQGIGSIGEVRLGRTALILTDTMYAESADDLIFFGKATVEEAQLIQQAMDLYCSVLGKMVN